MKICPKCGTIYKEQIRYCLNDGTALIEQTMASETPSIDYDEPETVVRSEPIIIDFGKPEKQSEPLLIDFSDVETVVHPPEQSASIPVTIIEKPVVKKGNYAIFLIAGLFLGGLLVLAALLLARNFFQDGNTNNGNAAVSNSSTVNSEIRQTPNQTIQDAAAKHSAPNASADINSLNGRVIAVNAYVRALPNKSSAQIDVLPIGDRLEIGARENPSSPWYQIKCEHGTSGWMHGNTIAFN